MDYFEQQRFNALERSFLDEPEPCDYEREDELFWERADMDYDSAREDAILCRE